MCSQGDSHYTRKRGALNSVYSSLSTAEASLRHWGTRGVLMTHSHWGQVLISSWITAFFSVLSFSFDAFVNKRRGLWARQPG